MAHSEIRKVALLGASGKLGKPLLAALLKQPQFTVTIIARQSSTAPYAPEASVVKVSDTYPKDELVSAFSGQDAVILAMSHAGNEHHRTLMDAAAEAGVKLLIPNHWSSNAESPLVQQLSSRFKILDEDIEYLRTKEDSGMTWTAIVTGIFFDLAFPYGLLGFDLRGHKAQIWDDGNVSFSASTNEDIATATMAVLQQPSLVRNSYVYISSFETTQNQLLSYAEKVSGQKWATEQVTRSEKVRQANDTIAAGAQGMQWMMAQGTLAAAALFGGKEYQSDFVASGRTSNRLLGLQHRDVQETVKTFVQPRES